jgi:hypothetical protein
MPNSPKNDQKTLHLVGYWFPRIVLLIGALYLFAYTAGRTAGEYISDYQGTGGAIHESEPRPSSSNGAKSEDRPPVTEEPVADKPSTGGNIQFVKEDRGSSKPSSGKNVAYAGREEVEPDKADINALAMAVAFAETGLCTKGSAITHLNCVGIRQNGKFVKYASHNESLDDFKKRWSRSYGGRYPTYKDAVAWTGNDRVDTWRAAVAEEYERRIKAKQ